MNHPYGPYMGAGSAAQQPQLAYNTPQDPDLRAFIENTAHIMAGDAAAADAIQHRHAGDPRYSFLHQGTPYHAYFQSCFHHYHRTLFGANEDYMHHHHMPQDWPPHSMTSMPPYQTAYAPPPPPLAARHEPAPYNHSEHHTVAPDWQQEVSRQSAVPIREKRHEQPPYTAASHDMRRASSPPRHASPRRSRPRSPSPPPAPPVSSRYWKQPAGMMIQAVRNTKRRYDPIRTEDITRKRRPEPYSTQELTTDPKLQQLLDIYYAGLKQHDKPTALSTE